MVKLIARNGRLLPAQNLSETVKLLQGQGKPMRTSKPNPMLWVQATGPLNPDRCQFARRLVR